MSVSEPSTPRESLPKFFAAVDLAIDDCASALEGASGRVSDTHAARLTAAMRGLTLLQAARLLLEERHWEVAAGVARQLFELLVNVEHLLAQPDEEVAWAEYRTFALAANLQTRRRGLNYALEDGYRDVHDYAADLDARLAQAEFSKYRDRYQNIRESWSGQSVRRLSKQSRNGNRFRQYEYYYRTWSEQTHSNPSVLIESMIPFPPADAIGEIIERADREAMHLIVMSVRLFSDLVTALDTLHPSTKETVGSWLQALRSADEQRKDEEARARGSAGGS